MSTLSPEQRGDLAENMLPTAANLAVLVHGDGGPEDVAAVLAGLDDTAKNALIVVLAGLVDPDQPVGKALGWLDFNEHGTLTVPSWSEQRSVRDLVPEADVVLDGDYVDQVAVAKFVKGFQVGDLTDAEFLEAIKQCVASGLSLADVDRMRRWPAKTTETRVNRMRKQWQRSGREFPALVVQGQRKLTDAEVVTLREKAAAGSTDTQLAVLFDVTRETVRAIVSGKRRVRAGGPIREVRSAKSVKASREYMCGHGDGSLAARNQKAMEEAA